ncbi:TPA: hypothetical protein ACH3X2_007544 [Trebouxia sp. C0005]
MERTGQGITQSSSQAEPQVYQQLAGLLATKPGSESNAGSAAAQSTFRVFERGGVMTALGEYVAEANSAADPAPVSRKPASATNRLGPQISSSNVGYQLLQKAGWQEGQGIGINQQGRPIPLSAYHQQARHGIGADNKPANAAHAHRRTGSKRTDSSSGHAYTMHQLKQKEQQPVPDVPEDPVVKKQRHQQILQAEADEAAGRAIQQYMYRAFNDRSGEPTSDSNPLLRQHKLSKTNPLL